MSSFHDVPPGPSFSEEDRGRVLADLGSVERLPLEKAPLGRAASALRAIELDRRLPPQRIVSIPAGRGRVVDLDGVVRLRLPRIRRAGSLRLAIESDVPSLPRGFAYGWPPALYSFPFTGEIASSKPVQIEFAVAGISQPIPRTPLHVLEWDGRSFRDVTAGHPAPNVVTAATGTLRSYVLVFPWRGVSTTVACDRPVSFWKRIWRGLRRERPSLLLHAHFAEDAPWQAPATDLTGPPEGDAIESEGAVVVDSPELGSLSLRLERGATRSAAKFVPTDAGEHDSGLYRLRWTAHAPLAFAPLSIRIASSSNRNAAVFLLQQSYVLFGSAEVIGDASPWVPHRLLLEIDMDEKTLSVWKDGILRISERPLDDPEFEDIAALEFAFTPGPIAPSPVGAGGSPAVLGGRYLVDDVRIERVGVAGRQDLLP
jgi:hypothetical protein